MKNFRTPSWMALFGLVLMVLTAGSAFAAGTNAGDTISNQATLDYEVGGVNQPDIDSDGDGNAGNGTQPTTFLVDNRVDLSMSGTDNGTASGTGQILVFTIENTGNEDQRYALELFTGVDATDDITDFDNVTIYYDADNSGTVTAGDTIYTSGAGTPIVDGGGTPVDVPANAAGSTIQVLVVGDAPSGATNGQTAAYTLKAVTLNASDSAETTATAGADTTGVDVVLADGAAVGGVTGVADAVEDGDFYATATYTVQTAQLSITKAAVVISDPINGVSANAKAIPGAVVEYTITVTNNGVPAADLLVLTDPIPANTWFIVGSVTAVGSSSVDYDDSNAGTWSGIPTVEGDGSGTDHSISDVRVQYVTLAGGGTSHQMTFQVMIQ